MGRKKTKGESFCDINADRNTMKGKSKSAFYKHKGGLKWRGVKDQPYKTAEGGWSNIIRRVLIGAHGESTKFHVRYFEIYPEGRSSLEKHRHEHVVICVKGEGVVLTGKKKRKIGFMDTVYISPDTVHQLSNPFREPFGFLCIVNSKRDKPHILQ